MDFKISSLLHVLPHTNQSNTTSFEFLIHMKNTLLLCRSKINLIAKVISAMGEEISFKGYSMSRYINTLNHYRTDTSHRGIVLTYGFYHTNNYSHIILTVSFLYRKHLTCYSYLGYSYYVDLLLITRIVKDYW